MSLHLEKTMTEAKKAFYSNERDKVIFDLLRENKPLTRKEIVDIVNLPRTTVYDMLERLERDGKVKSITKTNGKIGRPRVLWTVRSQYKKYRKIKQKQEKKEVKKIENKEIKTEIQHTPQPSEIESKTEKLVRTPIHDAFLNSTCYTCPPISELFKACRKVQGHDRVRCAARQCVNYRICHEFDELLRVEKMIRGIPLQEASD